MAKKSTYSNPEYVLSYGKDDVIFIDLEVEITRTLEGERENFTMEIARCQLNVHKMEFASFMIEQLGVEGLRNVYNKIRELVQVELQPELFSLFYVGNIQD